MYQYNKKYRRPQYETNDEYSLQPEFEMENGYGNTEFNYESDNEYELVPGFEIGNEMEYDNEYDSNELSDEYNPANETGGYKDEMEMELENVTNEKEFSNWVNEIIVRDHRNQNLRSVIRRPIGQRAISHLSSIASRTLPWLGTRRGGWRGASVGSFGRPIINNFRFNSGVGGLNRAGYWQRRRYPYWRNNFGQQSPFPDPAQQAAGFAPADPGSTAGGGGVSAPAPVEQDGSFKSFVIDTIKNLSQQIAAGNESIEALKSSVTSSAASNFPGIVQPKTDPGTPPPAAAAPAPTSPEFENNYGYEMETEPEITDNESSFSEETEMELASDLLAVKNEMELDHFLGDLFKKAVGAVSGILGGGQGNILGGVLKSVVKKALPLAGAAAGTFFGGPLGTAIGGQIGSAASGLFELELEGLSHEDQEFEVARALVRFAGNAARQVADNATGNPEEDVRNGVTEAAMRYAPGLLRRKHHRHHHHHRRYDNNGYGDSGGAENGTWHRRGNRIIIDNI